ncbi:MAG: DUF2281 domain-containing protein [bacterium]
MTQVTQQIITEIQDLPPDNQKEILDFVREIKMKIPFGKRNGKDIKRFAGMWSDLSENEITELESLYRNRDKYLQVREFDG